MDNNLVERLKLCYSGILHDVMRVAGLKNFVLSPNLRALNPKMKLAGPIWSVSGNVVDADNHETLLAWTNILSKAPSGHVLIIQPNDNVAAFMGELSAETLQYKGLYGALVDGGCRDSEFILNINFPVWARHYTPIDVVGYWLPKYFNNPIKIGDVIINPGDYIFGDRDGVVVIPKSEIKNIITEAEVALAKENLVRKAILQGVDPKEAYLKYRKF